VSNTLDVEFCREALEEALARFGRPEIFNTDQETGSEVRAGLSKWIGYYNTGRPHSALAGRTPTKHVRRTR
jgi:putative transposase